MHELGYLLEETSTFKESFGEVLPEELEGCRYLFYLQILDSVRLVQGEINEEHRGADLSGCSKQQEAEHKRRIANKDGVFAGQNAHSNVHEIRNE